MIGVLIKASAGKEVLENDQVAEVFLARFRQEVRNPRDCVRCAPTFAQLAEPRHIVGRAVVACVVGEVDHDPPFRVTVHKVTIEHVRVVAHVAKLHRDGSLVSAPHVVESAADEVVRRQSELVGDELANQLAPGLLIVLGANAVENRVVVDTAQGRGDDRVISVANADLAEFAGPCARAREHLFCLAAWDESVNSAPVEGGELRGSEVRERLRLRCQRSDQNGLCQSVLRDVRMVAGQPR